MGRGSQVPGGLVAARRHDVLLQRRPAQTYFQPYLMTLACALFSNACWQAHASHKQLRTGNQHSTPGRSLPYRVEATTGVGE
jgi:hypothetical protein